MQTITPAPPRVEAPRLVERLDIQGLRAVAVALVVLDHVGVPLFGGGYVGVDVFFVVSGYLISSLLLREARLTGRVSLAGFYARRARRILPAATVVLVAVTVYSALALSLERARQVVEDVIWSSVFLANVHLSRLGTDYFSQDRPPSPVQHYWSLAVEEQFYLVWPLLLAVLVALGIRHRRTAVGLAVLCGLSLLWSVVATHDSPTAAYFSSLTRAWELGTGALLALGAARLAALGERHRRALATVGLGAILLATLTFDERTAFPGWAALLPVLGTAALLASGAAADGIGPGALLTRPALTWLGDRSFSVYLWHWPVLLLGGEALALPRFLEAVLLLALTMGLSLAGYHLVEQPFRRGRLPLSLSRGRSALALWPLAVGSVLVATAWVGMHQDSELEARAAAAEEYYDGLSAAADPGAATSIADKVAREVALGSTEAPVHFPLENLDGLPQDVWRREYPCYANYTQTDAELCPIGDPDSSVTVVAFGDSHMGMWVPALDDIGESQGLRIVPLVKWACPSYEVPVRSLQRAGSYAECDEFRDWAATQIADLQPDVVLLANRGMPGGMLADPTQQVGVWEDGVATTATAMRELSPQVVVLGDVPRVGVDPGDCLSAQEATVGDCTVDEFAHSIEANEATERAAASAGVRFVDVVPFVCADGRCPLAVDQTVTYRDDDHLSVTWVRRLAEELGRLLDLPSRSAG